MILKVKHNANQTSFSAGSSTLPDSASRSGVAGGWEDPSVHRDAVQAPGEVAWTPTYVCVHAITLSQLLLLFLLHSCFFCICS